MEISLTKNLMSPPFHTERLVELASAFKLPTVAAQLGPRLRGSGPDEALETVTRFSKWKPRIAANAV